MKLKNSGRALSTLYGAIPCGESHVADAAWDKMKECEGVKEALGKSLKAEGDPKRDKEEPPKEQPKDSDKKPEGK